MQQAAKVDHDPNPTQPCPAKPLTAEDLCPRYLGPVYTLALRVLGHREDAQDITGEVFLAAVRSLDRYSPEWSPEVWLFGITWNKLRDARRSRRRSRELLSADPWSLLAQDLAPTAAPISPGNTELGRFEELLPKLPKKQRAAVLLRYGHDLTVDEIAAVLACTPAAVNSLLQRARATLQYQAVQASTLEGPRRAPGHRLSERPERAG